MSKTKNKYPAELRERAVRMVMDGEGGNGARDRTAGISKDALGSG
jgi:hypothetical protein